VPAVFTGFIFWILGRKGMTSTKAILIIILLALGCSAAGYFLFGMK
ncbi:PTS fructose transporter subunit IID, partial [Enterococcus cecorum]|nr:PTS fructose transporter subunit IID [Enterococcus cecorum]